MVTLVALAGAVGGCGGGDDDDEPQDRRAPGAQPSAEVRAALGDPESSVVAVREFFQDLQDGALVSAIGRYEPAVVRAVGVDDFAGMIATRQGVLAGVRLTPFEVEEVAGGEQVKAEGVTPAGDRTRYAFFLREVDGEWRIVYDSFSAFGLVTYVQGRAQRDIDPTVQAPGIRAGRVAEASVERMRRAALRLIDAIPRQR